MAIKICAVALCLFSLTAGIAHAPFPDPVVEAPVSKAEEQPIQLNKVVADFLKQKDSPLASDADFIVTLQHWQLVVAISAIESQYCKTNPVKHNCWGIMKGKALRRFDSYRDGAQYTSNLIEYWRSRGKWLTVDSMNCSYVVPCNKTWVAVVKNNINILNELPK